MFQRARRATRGTLVTLTGYPPPQSNKVWHIVRMFFAHPLAPSLTHPHPCATAKRMIRQYSLRMNTPIFFNIHFRVESEVLPSSLWRILPYTCHASRKYLCPSTPACWGAWPSS